MKKREIEKIFNKLDLEVRTTGQLKLSTKDFKNLIKCPLTYQDYIAILKQKGIIS